MIHNVCNAHGELVLKYFILDCTLQKNLQFIQNWNLIPDFEMSFFIHNDEI